MLKKKECIHLGLIVVFMLSIAGAFVYLSFDHQKRMKVEHTVEYDYLDYDGQKDSLLKFHMAPRGGKEDSWLMELTWDAVYENGLMEFMDYDGNDGDGSPGRSGSSETSGAVRKNPGLFLHGITYDAVLENRSSDEISRWQAEFTVRSRCYLAKSWCGTVEIIQYRGPTSTTQILDMRNMDSLSVYLDHIVVGDDILIALYPGDKVIYHPSGADKEYPISHYDPAIDVPKAIFGSIVYTFDDSEVVPPSATLTYFIRPDFTAFVLFRILVCLVFVLFALVIAFILSIVYRTKIERLEEHDKKKLQQVMEIFTSFIDAKDSYTGGHSIRVAEYSKQIALELDLPEDEAQQVFYCALMHDCGKIGIPDRVLGKPGFLDEDEYMIIKAHTEVGSNMLLGLTSIPHAREVSRHHHERFDGKGYPDRLKGQEIPLYARIVCVADSFDAMNTSRCYRGKMDKGELLAEIHKSRGVQFDPEVADALMRLIYRGEITVG